MKAFFRFFWNLYRNLGGICVGFLVRTFREGCHNCFLRVQVNIWRKKFWAKVFFIFVWHWGKKVLAFRQKCFEVVVNIAFYVSRGSSSKFFVLVKKVVSAIKFGQWANKVGALTKKFSAGESYLLLRVPRKVLENNSFSKGRDFCSSSDIEWKIFRLLSKPFRRAFKKCNSLGQRKNLRKLFSLKKGCTFFSFSENQSKNSGLVAQFFQWDFKESMLTIRKKTFWYFDQVFHENVFASYCHWAGETFFDLWRKSFCRIVKTAPYVSRLPFGWLFEFSGKKSLFLNQFQTSISEIVSGLLSINFQLDFSELRSTYTKEHF